MPSPKAPPECHENFEIKFKKHNKYLKFDKMCVPLRETREALRETREILRETVGGQAQKSAVRRSPRINNLACLLTGWDVVQMSISNIRCSSNRIWSLVFLQGAPSLRARTAANQTNTTQTSLGPTCSKSNKNAPN